MKGLVTPILVWALVALPFLMLLLRAKRAVFVTTSLLVCAGAVSIWILSAGYGWRISENMTASLDGHVYVYRNGEEFRKGDLVAFRWQGGATYPAGVTFIKRVVGVPGDVVRREGNKFWVGDQYIGVAKPVSKAGVPLQAASAGVIPPGEYFVATPSPDSLDSRYALTGNIKQMAIIGRAHELF